MGKVKLLFYMIFMISFMSCSKDMNEIVVDEELQNVDVEDIGEVANMVIGKWQVLTICGGVVGCTDCEDFYMEYTADMCRTYEKDSLLSETPIKEWRITESGCEILTINKELLYFVEEVDENKLIVSRHYSVWDTRKVK